MELVDLEDVLLTENHGYPIVYSCVYHMEHLLICLQHEPFKVILAVRSEYYLAGALGR